MIPSILCHVLPSVELLGLKNPPVFKPNLPTLQTVVYVSVIQLQASTLST